MNAEVIRRPVPLIYSSFSEWTSGITLLNSRQDSEEDGAV